MIKFIYINKLTNIVYDKLYFNLSILNSSYDYRMRSPIIHINNEAELTNRIFFNIPHETLICINKQYYVNDLSSGKRNITSVYDYIDSENYNYLNIKYVRIKNLFLKKDFNSSINDKYNKFYIFSSIDKEEEIVNCYKFNNDDESEIVNIEKSKIQDEVYILKQKYDGVYFLYKECLDIEKFILKRSSSRLSARWDEDLKFLNELINEKHKYIEDLDKVKKALVKIETELFNFKKCNGSSYFSSIDKNIDISTRLDAILHPDK